MRTAKAVLALLVSASLALPASAQVRAAAAVAGSALPRVSLSAPLAPSAAPFPSLSAAPIYSPAASAAPAPSAAPALSPEVSAVEAAPAAAASAEAEPVAALPARASALPDPAPAEAASARARWESFWSGSSARGGSETPSAASPDVLAKISSPAAPLPRPGARAASPSAAAPVAAAVLVPAARDFHALIAHAAPFLEAGGVLVGAYFANRGVNALLRRFAAKRGMDPHRVAVVRLVANVALWTGAAAAALIVGGASHATLTAVFGAGGTILTFGLREVLGNAIQGVSFLITRPFSIGAKVQIDDQLGTVSDVTLTAVLVKKDDGSEVKIRHSTLAAKPVIVFGPYSPDAKFRLAVPAKPKFKGALGAVAASLDRRFWLAGAAFAALLAVPAFVPFLAAGWAATAVHYALVGSIAWLTRRVDAALAAAVDHLARENSWRKETAAIARYALGAALWTLGGGAALRLLGVSWTALGASLGLTTLGIGLASNNFLGSVVEGGEILFSKTFKVGDRVQVGTFGGLVEDMTLYHVVLKLDDERHALVPYAVVRDATLVVTPGK